MDPQSANPIALHRSITVNAGASQQVIFNPASDPALTISHPQLWWPHQMGGQPLYHLATRVSQNAAVSDTAVRRSASARSPPGCGA